MNIPPVSPTDDEILVTVQRHWDLEIDAVAYFPVGFGAHHWQGCFGGTPVAFITLDQPESPGAQSSLQQAYAAAHELFDSGLEFVVPPVPAIGGGFIVPMSDGCVSVTPWVQGTTPSAEDASEPAHLLRSTQALMQLHACRLSASMPEWRQRVAAKFMDRLETLLVSPWDLGPMGMQARALILENVATLQSKACRYLELTEEAMGQRQRWVPTHGEPHFANQILSDGALRFVDWESLRLAPKERDVVGLPTAAWPQFQPNPAMIDLFRLEWTLAEIDEYAHWFSAEHTGDADDLLALEKLRSELAED